MHAHETTTDVELVRRLVGTQFPAWAHLPITPVASYGTDHDIYRLGAELCARLPRVGWATAQAEKEARWLPWLAPRLPLVVPVQVAMGEPAYGYPYRWSVCEWLPGSNAHARVDLPRAAADLAGFVRALRAIDTTGAHPRPADSRGGVLAEHDDTVRDAVSALGDRVDAAALLRSWDDSVRARPSPGPEVWLHADLLPGNLLVRDSRLSAVIDWGGLNVGDPACDLLPAWNLFSGAHRGRFRADLDVDDDQWRRGRGWALCQAVVALPYYWDTNPGMVRQASLALDEIVRSGG